MFYYFYYVLAWLVIGVYSSRFTYGYNGYVSLVLEGLSRFYAILTLLLIFMLWPVLLVSYLYTRLRKL